MNTLGKAHEIEPRLVEIVHFAVGKQEDFGWREPLNKFGVVTHENDCAFLIGK